MQDQETISTGVPGADEILKGGLVGRRAYLVRGGPGTGKTTFCSHFLHDGVTRGEKVLYITLGETEGQIRQSARQIGLDFDSISFLDLSPTSEYFTEVEAYDIFSPADVEREPVTRIVMDAVKEIQPTRVVVDSLTQIRYLSSDTFQFRKQVLSFLRYLTEHGATVLATSEGSSEAPDEDLQFLCDGVINLDFLKASRVLRVSKFRGSDFQAGRHAMRLSNTGMRVFPALVPEVHRRAFEIETISSGIPDLDALLHGGVERGTVTIITGPTGVGKTSLGAQFMKEAAGRGERSVLFTFEEEVGILISRCEGINIPVRSMIDSGTLRIVKVEPLQYSPDEFATRVREEVEAKGTRIVMVDSVAGYQLSLAGEDLVSHLHALCKYLQNTGTTTILINEKQHIGTDFMATEAGISYLADNILFLRYIEMRDSDGIVYLKKGVGVLKKRLTDFVKSLREMEITQYGIKVSRPLPGLTSILADSPSGIQS